MRLYLGLSLALHLAFLFAVLVLIGEPRPIVLTRPRLVEIESLGTDHAEGMDRKPVRKTGAPHGAGAPRKRIHLRDLGIFSSRSNRGLPAPGANPTDSEREFPYGYEDQLGGAKSPILSYLYQRIDGGIAYPAEFRGAKLEGEVLAKLCFDPNGRWIEADSEVKPNSSKGRFFRVYVLHQLRTLLSEPVPPNLWKADPHPLEIQARFNFEIVAPETQFTAKGPDGGQAIERRLSREREGQYGRRFEFHRVLLASPLAWSAGPIGGYGILPMFSINPDWFVRKVQDLVHHRDEIDPLDRYREDPDW